MILHAVKYIGPIWIDHSTAFTSEILSQRWWTVKYTINIFVEYCYNAVFLMCLGQNEAIRIEANDQDFRWAGN